MSLRVIIRVIIYIVACILLGYWALATLLVEFDEVCYLSAFLRDLKHMKISQVRVPCDQRRQLSNVCWVSSSVVHNSGGQFHSAIPFYVLHIFIKYSI